MDGSEWALGDKRRVCGEEVRDRVDPCDFERFIACEWREDPAECACEKRLTGTGSAGEEDVVTTGSSDLE
jgi:hypothetical protein